MNVRVNDKGGLNAGAAGEAADYEPARLLADLTAAQKVSEGSRERPSRINLADIVLMPDLFQPRGMSERHIGDLVRAIERFGEVDPVTVLVVGERPILVDGHHRVEAYRRAKKPAEIPVAYFEGTPQEAVLVAGEANSKAKLPMTAQERQNHAWRLVLLNKHSKADIARASGASESQIGNMRQVRRKLGEEAFDCGSWWQARKAAQGDVAEMNDDDREQWKQDLADRFADRLAKEFSTKLADRPEVAAMALAAYFGRRLPELLLELRAHVGGEEEDDSDEF